VLPVSPPRFSRYSILTLPSSLRQHLTPSLRLLLHQQRRRMAPRQARLHLQDRLSSRLQPPTARPPKDIRCYDDHVPDVVAYPDMCREACVRECDFAPTRRPYPWLRDRSVDGVTANRFGILAHLAQSPTQANGAFDFTKQTGPARRRGKRGGKHNKLKLQARKHREAGESDCLRDLCEKVAALSRDDEPLHASLASVAPTQQDGVPWTDFTFPTETFRHHWMPQFRPDAKSSTLSAPKTSNLEGPPLVQASERCLTKIEAAHSLEEITEPRRKESQFFPLSAFLAGPPSTADRAAPKTAPRPALKRKASFGQQLSIAVPTPAQKAAASAACRALASRVADRATSCQSTPHAAQSSSPLPPALNSHLIERRITPENPRTMALLSAPFPITPSHTVSPTLSTSPVISSAPSLACTPSIEPAVPLLQPPRAASRLPPKTTSTHDTAQTWAKSGLDESEPTSPLSLITAPITSPHPFVTLTKSSLATTSFAKSNPAVPFLPSLQTRDDLVPVNSVAQLELEDFLKMGHASPCWCSQSSSPSCRSVTSSSNPRPRSRNELTGIRKWKFDEPSWTAEIDVITMSPSSTSSHFDFEDLGSTGYDLLTPSGSEEDDGNNLREEEEWMVVTPGDDRYNRPTLFTKPAQEEPEIVSAPASVVYPSPPRTPVPTPRTLSPVNYPSHSEADGPGMPIPRMSPWDWPTYSP